jgi:type I protein arginine methyltransferase
MGYSDYEFGRMIGDPVRMKAYRDALTQSVSEGCTVLDIGAGTGIFSFICCELGAAKVYAVEPNDAVQLGRELTRANGFSDRIEWIQKLSTDVTLPEKVDVIVSDLRGVLPLFGAHIPSIIDARERFLRPQGTLIPQRDTLYAAIATDSSGYQQKVEPWDGNSAPFDFECYRQRLTNCISKDHAAENNLLSSGVQWATLDYSSVKSANVSGTVELEVTRSGLAHGLYIWFDATLLEGIGFSGGPGSPEMVYGCTFFPWPCPTALEKGDVATVEIRANFIGDEYLWRWNTSIQRANGKLPDSPERWQQTTGHHMIRSPKELRKGLPSHRAQLNPHGQLTLDALRLISEGNTTESLVDWLISNHGATIQSRAEAAQFLADKVWLFTE